MTTTNDKEAFHALATSLGSAHPYHDTSGAICVSGDENTLGAMHTVLVDAGCPVVSIAPIRETLEAYFIEKTEGEMG